MTHIFGGKTREGIYYSDDAVGGSCIKCGETWTNLLKKVSKIIQIEELLRSRTLTVSELRDTIKARHSCSVSNKEFRFMEILA